MTTIDMTTEQIAEFAKDKENYVLVPVLWEKTYRILYFLARKVYMNYYKSFTRCGIELSDLYQNCYMVFLNCLKAYDPQKQCKFSTYFKFGLWHEVNNLLGLQKKHPNLLDTSISLETPALADEKDGNAIGDFIPDINVNIEQDYSEKEEITSIINGVNDAIEKLQEPYKEIIKLAFFKNMNDRKIANVMEMTSAMIRSRKNKAFEMLRESKEMRTLYNQYLNEG
ncbi:MAG: sigma-70 family RNA polymerase sigma factor [Ruminococcus sp.]|nr:sigma-70 family RNA polymerase sigma factor [Ruminococcus sp.]